MQVGIVGRDGNDGILIRNNDDVLTTCTVGTEATGTTAPHLIAVALHPVAGFRSQSLRCSVFQSAKAYQKQVREEQEKMIRMIEETLGHPIAVKQRLTLTTNVISANVFPADIDAIRMVEGVVSVTEEIRHEITDGSTPLPAPPGQTATG